MPHCKALYNHSAVSVMGNITPCCVFKKPKLFNISNITQNEYLQSDYVSNIRKNMETGWDPGCIACKNDVESGRFSMMESINLSSSAEEFVIDSVEITPNNTCNFRCRTCSSHSSSRWAETLGEDFKFKKFDIANVLSNLDLKNMKTIKVMGGEPFLTDDLHKIIDLICDSGNTDLTLHTSTNLSLFPKKMLNSISKIKNFMIVFSIDGVGALNDYIRNDSDWETTTANLEQWLDFLRNNVPSHQAYIHTVVQSYNYHNIGEIKQFSNQHGLFHSTMLINSPDEFSINSLPPEYIEKYKTEFNIDFLTNYKFDHNLLSKLKRTTEIQDTLLGKDIQNYIPGLQEIFDKYVI